MQERVWRYLGVKLFADKDVWERGRLEQKHWGQGCLEARARTIEGEGVGG